MGILNLFVKLLSSTSKSDPRQSRSSSFNASGGGRIDYNQLLKNAVAQLPPEAVTIPNIGVIEPICPYCHKALKKMPTRKTACEFCGNAIRVTKRPFDKKKALFTESQLSQVEELTALYEAIKKMPNNLRIFKRELNEYQDLGLTQWKFLGCHDERAAPIERELDGRVVEIGSEDEKRMLVYLVDPRYRFCTNAVIESRRK
ncbi:hypothetical protein [Methanoregula formicica]|uniref:Uncharacterized protein n=1 Tax=Methanoregula formicica (strain DSM 22288 / NBRC 105244 / SMSP) TaxID=593750 RepID=L0HGG1_METFS|nr:hypothetical protein [Methanoregula formicica]AGB02413.1 hypothetical protein Metfor_1374 [Methanoregula formicica SMSP]